MNDKRYNFLMSIAERLPSDGTALKCKDMIGIMTEWQWKDCYKWLTAEAGEFVVCQTNHVFAKNKKSAKSLAEYLKRVKAENDKKLSISDVAEMLELPVSTIRFWERVFPQFKPNRDSSGRRYYTPEDIEICKFIKHLLREKGYSLEYTRRELEICRECPPQSNYVCETPEDALSLLREVTTIINGNLYAEARIKAVEKWIGSIDK